MPVEDNGAVPTFERRLDARLVIAVVAVGITSFAGVVVETAMNIAFPALMKEFGVSTSTVQWVTTGYLLVLAAIMPVSSFLHRRLRTRTLFALAMAAFLAGTVMCAAAPHFSLLVLGRLVQGVGTGIALPLMFNMVLEQVPLEHLGTMMGVATLITSHNLAASRVRAVAPAVGPSFGGYLIGALGWRSVFIVLLPFLVIAAVLGLLTIRQATRPRSDAVFSPLQFLVMAAGFTALVLATNAAGQTGWTSPRVLGLLALALVLVAAFCVLSSRSERPLIRIRIFADRTYTLSVVYVVLIQAVVLALGYLIPYYAQVSASMGSFAAGCLLLPGCVLGACLTPLGGRVLDRLGPARPILAGAVCGVLAMALFAAVGVDVPAPWLALVYVIMPLCQGLSVSNSMTNGLRSLPDHLQADGNAAFNTIQQLGGAVGTAVATAVVNAAQSAGSDDLAAATRSGTHTGFVVLLVLAVLALAAATSVFVSRGADRRAARGARRG